MVPELPDGAKAVIVVAFTTVYIVAAIPPKLTPVVPVKLVPVMVIVVPAVADRGIHDDRVGGGRKVKPAKESLPEAVNTFTSPVAPTLTTAEILVLDKTVKLEA